MNIYIQKLINEQFSISDLDFSDDDQEDNINIFNKKITNPEEVYNNILDDINVTYYEIQDLNTQVSLYAAKNSNDLKKIISYYSSNYPNDSLNWIDVSPITDMSRFFNGNLYKKIVNMYNGDISKWDTSNVTDMSVMFSYSMFKNNISQWDVSNVTNMSDMFERSAFNGDISKWDVSSVTNMSHMFRHSIFNQDISKWDVSNVTDMSYMFYISIFNQDISNWDVSSVTDMQCMFRES